MAATQYLQIENCLTDLTKSSLGFPRLIEDLILLFPAYVVLVFAYILRPTNRQLKARQCMLKRPHRLVVLPRRYTKAHFHIHHWTSFRMFHLQFRIQGNRIGALVRTRERF